MKKYIYKSVNVILFFSILLTLTHHNNLHAQEEDQNNISNEEQIHLIEQYPLHLRLRLKENNSSYKVNKMKISDDNDKKTFFWLYSNKKKWVPGQTLRICFIGGNPNINRTVVSIGSEWMEFANIKFDSGPNPNNPRICKERDDSEIRIAYTSSGTWALTGKESIDLMIVEPGVPTMNLMWFDIKPPPPFIMKSIILHEFGHVLGLLHEHQNPNAKCEDQIIWEGPNGAYALYRSEPPHPDRNDIDFNLRSIENYSIFRPGDELDPKFSQPDYESITFYLIPPEILKGGINNICYNRNYVISERDKEIVSRLYPKDPKLIANVITDRLDTINTTLTSFEFDQSKESHLLVKNELKNEQVVLITAIGADKRYEFITDATVVASPPALFETEGPALTEALASNPDIRSNVFNNIDENPNKYGLTILQ